MAKKKVATKSEVQPECHWCHQKGGRVRIDPYREEIYNERVKIRIHDACLPELLMEI